MGSTARGLITGYVCRLCSKMNRYVILIYGDDGERLNLATKINLYLPITINRRDPLPKTVCIECVERLERHHRMMEMMNSVRLRLEADINPAEEPITSRSLSQGVSPS